MLLAFGWVDGTLKFVYFGPFGVAALVPLCTACCRQGPSRHCIAGWAKKLAMILCFVLSAPFVCLLAPFAGAFYAMAWAVRHPMVALERVVQSLNPLGPGPQVYIAIA